MSILAATDFSDRSATSVRQAARLASDWGSSLVLLHAVETAANQPSWVQTLNEPNDMQSKWRKGAENRLEEFVEEHVPASERPERVLYRVGFDYTEESIESLLEVEDFELVVLGATGENRVANALLGSTPESVVRRSDVPVLVIPESGRVGGYDQIVAPVDFTECSRRSLEQAAAMARDFDSELAILHAYQFPVAETPFLTTQMSAESLESYEEESKNEFREFLDQFDLEEIDWEPLHVSGSAHNVIADAVDSVGADLVVMGTHGRRGFERLFLGSTATKLLRKMPCSVMTVRTPEE